MTPIVIAGGDLVNPVKTTPVNRPNMIGKIRTKNMLILSRRSRDMSLIAIAIMILIMISGPCR